MSAARALGAPLVWNVAGLMADDPGATRDYEVAGATIDLGDDLRLAEPIEGHVRLARTNRGLIVSASFETAIEAQCSRCLRDIEVPIQIAIDEEARPSVDIHTGAPVRPEPGEEDESLRLTDHHELDLEAPVREAIQLAEPIAPLCKETCRGLCPTCGERLEEGTHDHPTDDVDPRLEVLRNFKVGS
jgi:DUF177 domain-containing protein